MFSVQSNVCTNLGNPFFQSIGVGTTSMNYQGPFGGYPGNDDDGRQLQRKRDRNEMLEDFMAAFEYLKGRPDCNGKVGVVGFCFGGWISNMMAVVKEKVLC